MARGALSGLVQLCSGGHGSVGCPPTPAGPAARCTPEESTWMQMGTG